MVLGFQDTNDESHMTSDYCNHAKSHAHHFKQKHVQWHILRQEQRKAWLKTHQDINSAFIRSSTDIMAGRLPLEVGTRGTIGSLLKREMEYFKKLDLECAERQMNSDRRRQEMAPGGRHSWPSFRLSGVSWRRKKRRNSGIRPGICSMVEVADSQGLNDIPGFSYQNLRADSKRYDV